jgi:hypothetical protein
VLFGQELKSARATGLEPATTGSTVRYSNQLSYAPSDRENSSRRWGRQPSRWGNERNRARWVREIGWSVTAGGLTVTTGSPVVLGKRSLVSVKQTA